MKKYYKTLSQREVIELKQAITSKPLLEPVFRIKDQMSKNASLTIRGQCKMTQNYIWAKATYFRGGAIANSQKNMHVTYECDYDHNSLLNATTQQADSNSDLG